MTPPLNTAALCGEMIRSAISDLFRPTAKIPDREHELARESARLWLADATDQGGLSFALCCDVLGLDPIVLHREFTTLYRDDPKALRERVKARWTPGPKPRPRGHR